MRMIFLVALFCSAAINAGAGEGTAPNSANNVRTINRAFAPGERLQYAVSWSRILDAGVASMEVRQEQAPDGKKALRIVSTARSTGLAGKIYPVMDTVESLMDAEEMYSLFYDVDQKHGRRRKKRTAIFDQTAHTARLTTDGVEETYEVPPRIQDPLSSLYYIRTLTDFTPGTPIIVDIHEKGKNWSVEVQVLGKEKIETPLGNFDTVKIKTFPKFEGVFMHKGEIFVWLTDDERRIPVMMKSTITIGSIVAVLTNMKTGEQVK